MVSHVPSSEDLSPFLNGSLHSVMTGCMYLPHNYAEHFYPARNKHHFNVALLSMLVSMRCDTAQTEADAISDVSGK